MSDAVYKQVIDNVVTIIKGLSLHGIGETEIVARKLPRDVNMWPVGVTVSWDDERIDDNDPAEGTNQRDMLGYPCVVTIVRGTGHGWSDRMDTISTWRQQIRRAFHCKRPLTSVTGASQICCKVTHENPIVPQEYLDSHDVSQQTIWCWFLEERT